MPFFLPIVLAAAGLGAKFGLDYFEDEADAEKAGGFLEAIRSARTAVPGSEVGETGPELPSYRTDWSRVGEALLESGDPTGLNIAMRAELGRSEAAASSAASAEEHRRRMELEAYKQGEQNKRLAAELKQREALNQQNIAAGYMPSFHAPGSAEWASIVEEGTNLKYTMGILRDFQNTLGTFGTESWGEASGRLSGQRQQLMLFLKDAEKTGAIDAGTVELFETMLPDPTGLTGDLLNEEVGKLSALVDLFNSKYLQAYNMKRAYTTGTPEVGMIPSEAILPPGFEAVDEGEMERERDLQRALDREERQRRGAGITYTPQREIEEGLDALTRRFTR